MKRVFYILHVIYIKNDAARKNKGQIVIQRNNKFWNTVPTSEQSFLYLFSVYHRAAVHVHFELLSFYDTQDRKRARANTAFIFFFSLFFSFIP